MAMSMECPESSVIRRHNDRLLRTIVEDFSYFSSKFQEKAFVSVGVIRELSSMSGVGNRAIAHRLLNCPLNNLTIATDKPKWFREFVGVFSVEAAYKELATIMMKAYHREHLTWNQVQLEVVEKEAPIFLQITASTASSAVPPTVASATASDVGASVLRTEDETSRLQAMFFTLLAHTKTEFWREERGSTGGEFLIMFKSVLTNLLLFTRDPTLKFLEHERDVIAKANGVYEIFDTLEPYWNYSDYGLLVHIIQEFGTSQLQKELKKYIGALEEFEKTTTMEDCGAASLVDVWVPAYFKAVTITLDKDPSKFTLYQVRQLKNDILSRSTLSQYAVLRVDIPSTLATSDSNKIHFAFPPEAFQELKNVFNKHFFEVHNIVNMVFSDFSDTVQKEIESALQAVARKRCPDGYEIKDEDKNSLFEVLKISPSRTSDGYHYQCSCRADYKIHISEFQDSGALLRAVSAAIVKPMAYAPCGAVVGGLFTALIGALIALMIAIPYEFLYLHSGMLVETFFHAPAVGAGLGAGLGAVVGIFVGGAGADCVPRRGGARGGTSGVAVGRAMERAVLGAIRGAKIGTGYGSLIGFGLGSNHSQWFGPIAVKREPQGESVLVGAGVGAIVGVIIGTRRSIVVGSGLGAGLGSFVRTKMGMWFGKLFVPFISAVIGLGGGAIVGALIGGCIGSVAGFVSGILEYSNLVNIDGSHPGTTFITISAGEVFKKLHLYQKRHNVVLCEISDADPKLPVMQHCYN